MRVTLALLDKQQAALDLLSALQSFAVLVSLLMETSALSAALEPSRPTMNPLLPSASSAQLESFPEAAQVVVVLVKMDLQRVALELRMSQTAFQ